MRNATLAAVFSGALLLASSVSADVHLTISNGQVTLSAKDATVPQILAEWSRVGQTKIVNGDRVSGTPLTLELANISEEQALDIILRSVSGYLAAPRSKAIGNASRYDRILVMPTSTGTRAAASAAPTPTFQQPQFNPPTVAEPDDDQDDEPVRAPGAPAAPNGGRPPIRRGPIFNAYPPSQALPANYPPPQGAPRAVAPQGQPLPAPGAVVAPTMPTGSAVPGMIVPAPPQPGQPGSLGTPQEPQ